MLARAAAIAARRASAASRLPATRLGPHAAAGWTRPLRTTPRRLHGDHEWEDPASPEEVVTVIVIDRNGDKHEVKGKVGDNLLYIFHRWRRDNPSLALEGACEASLACSTCHVIVREKKGRSNRVANADADARVRRGARARAHWQIDDDHFDKLDEPSEDEEDMLDMAVGLTASSRLGCQIILSKDIDGIEVKLPAHTRNFYVDGHVPEPH